MMPHYEARVRVDYNEIWSVEAADEAEARNKLDALHGDVDADDNGEVIDWEVGKIILVAGDE